MQRRCLNCDSLCPVVPDHMEPLKFCDAQCRAEYRALQAKTLDERKQREAKGDYNGSWRDIKEPSVTNYNGQSKSDYNKQVAKEGDFWIYDKLEMFKRQNIACGTMDTMPKTQGEYVIQPYSIFGKGNAQKATLYADWDCYTEDTDFWSVVLQGTRYKVTFENGTQVLAVEAQRDSNVALNIVNKWITVNKKFELPNLKHQYKNITVTYIDNKIVDIYLGKNDMFLYGNAQAIPVAHGASTKPPAGYQYQQLPTHKHLAGIFYK